MEDANWNRDEQALNLHEDTGIREIPRPCEVPYDMPNLEFTRRFNDLARAMQAFSKSYNGGHVIRVREVMEVRDALSGLERSVWFDFRNRSGLRCGLPLTSLLPREPDTA
jgi:hypothetical protein